MKSDEEQEEDVTELVNCSPFDFMMNIFAVQYKPANCKYSLICKLSTNAMNDTT